MVETGTQLVVTETALAAFPFRTPTGAKMFQLPFVYIPQIFFVASRWHSSGVLPYFPFVIPMSYSTMPTNMYPPLFEVLTQPSLHTSAVGFIYRFFMKIVGKIISIN